MTRRLIWTFALGIACACGSVDSIDNLGEPVVTVVAKLESAPENMPTSNLRATLVWLNTPPFGGLDCHDEICDRGPRSYTVLTTSDVEVEMAFPLTVRLGVFELPAPLASEYPGSVMRDQNERLHLMYNSVPEAEVVLYEDGNQNQRLDLLLPGEAGPGPDHVVAISSGIDAQGYAVRTAIVNKRSPVPAGFASDGAFSLEAFAFPLPKELDPEGTLTNSDALFLPPGTPVPPVYPDGVYTLRLSAPPEQAAVQAAILKAHNLVEDPLTADSTLLSAAQLSIAPIEGTVVALYPVGTGERSWLARACNPFPQKAGAFLEPPAGSEVQCGAGALRFATNPGDYCGFARTVDTNRVQLENLSWWPCDDHGLVAGTPYRAAARSLDIDLRHQWSIVGEDGFGAPVAQRCDGGRIVHADASLGLHMPAAAPPAGSQIMCYGSDAFSFIPPRADGCLFKYTYDLAMQLPAEGLAQGEGWDMRAQPPAWWPCDANGELRPGTAFVRANVPPATGCPAQRTVVWTGVAPGHARVRCESAETFEYQPLWSDGCPALKFTLRSEQAQGGSFEGGDAWPCDAQGQFMPDKGFLPWQ